MVQSRRRQGPQAHEQELVSLCLASADKGGWDGKTGEDRKSPAGRRRACGDVVAGWVDDVRVVGRGQGRAPGWAESMAGSSRARGRARCEVSFGRACWSTWRLRPSI